MKNGGKSNGKPSSLEHANMMSLLIGLAILTAVGFLVLWYKVELETRNLKLMTNSVYMQGERMKDDGKIKNSVMMDDQEMMMNRETTIAFQREGLLKDNETEKQIILDHVVYPFIDYFETQNLGAPVSMVVEVPQSVGQVYSFNAVFKNGGLHGFLHGQRGGVIEYWTPDCMGACVFSVEYADKYPEVIQTVEEMLGEVIIE